ncbi:MAG: FAD-binding oxidoreductase [Rhodopirellula sp.]|nr:FAD-binding oxidoreductase [Rhodopirellula sp.]
MFEHREQLSGWGNCPRETCRTASPGTWSAQHAAVMDSPSVIARGMGRSYGDPALNSEGLVLNQTAMRRMLSFDDRTGILECEAGVSFAEIIEVLLPRGWFLPTSPGTKFVSVGGAIAADVHGKNHHRVGSIGNFIHEIQLLLASGDVLICSPQSNSDVFQATVGGMGLTGIIQTAKLQLTRVPSAYCKVTYQRTKNLDHTLEQFIDTDGGYEYSVAWVDCLSGGKSLGRSVLMLGNGAVPEELNTSQRAQPYALPVQRSKTVPGWFPASLMNRASIRAFNEVFYRAPRPSQAIVDFDKYFYPLDGLNHWNRMYGAQGFVQYQAWFPETTSRQGLIELLAQIVASGRGSFLAVLKSCGAASPGMLSFLDRGHTLALDFKNTGPDLLTLSQELDRIVLQHGGRLYLAKDAMMNAETFAAMYPRLPEFRQVQAAVDPEGKFISSQARRLQIICERRPETAAQTTQPHSQLVQ